MRKIESLATILVLGSHAGFAYGQAWVDEPNSFSASFGYSFAFSSKIVETDDLAFDPAPIQHHVFLIGLEYTTPLEGLAVSASLPMVLTRWDEENGGAAGTQFGVHGPYDDGRYHFIPTDLRFQARYNPLVYFDLPIATAISVGASLPTHDYSPQGFAAPGRDLWKIHFGLAFGATLAPWVPNLYFHATYEFSYVQDFETQFPETAEYVQHHSDVSAQIGYFILDNLEINAGLDTRIAHGGLDFKDFGSVSQPVQDFHDALLRENNVLVGGGISYSPIEDLTLDVLFRVFAYGTNTRNAHVVGAGIGYRIF